MSKETNIQHLRNKLSPSFNLAVMVEKHFVARTNLEKLVKRESKVASKNHKEIVRLINLVEKENERLKKKNKELLETINGGK